MKDRKLYKIGAIIFGVITLLGLIYSVFNDIDDLMLFKIINLITALCFASFLGIYISSQRDE